MSLRESLDNEDAPFGSPPPSVRRTGLRVGSATHPLVSLTLDYASLLPEQWAELLGSIRALGFRMVDVIVGWEHHERLDGTLDFGEAAQGLDLASFLRLAHQHGLFVCLRPGPRQFDAKVFAHLGLPAAVATDAACALPRAPNSALSLGQADAAGPSFASSRYLRRARDWLEQVGILVRPLCHPHGPVVAAHLEWARSLSPYESGSGDTHPDALEALARRNPRASTEEASPMGEMSVRRRDVDWVSAQERLALDGLDQLASALWRGCPGLPITFPEFSARSRLQLRFFDVSMRLPPDARRWATSGQKTLLDAWGGSVPIVDVDLEREPKARPLHQTLLCLAAGARGFSVTPGARRSAHSGSGACLLLDGGEPTPWMAELAPLLAALERTQFHTLQLEPCVHIVLCDRLLHLERAEQAMSQADGWLSVESGLARESRPPPHAEVAELAELRKVVGWLEQSLTRNGIPFRHALEWELDSVIGAAPWTVVPVPTAVSEELRETLEYGVRRGLPCSIGPFLPSGFVREGGAAEWPFLLGTTEQAIEAQVQGLLAQGQLPRRDVVPTTARVFFHMRKEPSGEVPAVAFVLNTSGVPIECSVACPGWTARDALTQSPIASFAERMLVPVPGESIRMLELFAADSRRDENY